MFVIKHRKIFYSITGLLLALVVFAAVFLGFRFSIDFTGGVSAQITYDNEKPAQQKIEQNLDKLELGNYTLNPLGENSYILRAHEFTQKEEVINAFKIDEKDFSQTFSSISPIIGKEMTTKAQVAIGIAILAIIIFIAVAFRKAVVIARTDKPTGVSSLKYGFIAILALLHDMAIPFGVFVLLSHFTGAEINILIVTALLTILGYSVNDTIVVFDRIRENIERNREDNREEEFELTVGKSLSQVYPRSINTSLTTVVVLIALFLIGAQATQNFALILATGVIAGTYSSIFLAAPLLVTFEKRREAKK